VIPHFQDPFPTVGGLGEVGRLFVEGSSGGCSLLGIEDDGAPQRVLSAKRKVVDETDGVDN